MMKIGIVGCGAIGSSLAKIISQDFRRSAKLVALYDIEPKRSEGLSRKTSGAKKLSTDTLSRLVAKSDLVIEAASAKSSWIIARKAILSGKDIMIMSVGGVLSHHKQLAVLASKYNSKVYIPSGAVSGIDALKAARRAGLRSVIITTRKNPGAFKDVDYVAKKIKNLDKLRGDKVIFFGSAKQAVKHFPQNINVAAVLSMAGIGEDKTQVKLIASCGVRNNIHEIQIESNAGRVFTRTENIVHPDNPKTSYLAVLAAGAVLRQILEPIKIGT